MWFIVNAQGEYLSMKKFPQVSYVPCEEKNVTEIFHIQWRQACSCTQPVVYLTGMGFSMDPFDAIDLSKLMEDGSLNMERVIYDACDLTKCAMDMEEYGYTIIRDVLTDDQTTFLKGKLELVGEEQIRRSDLLERDELFGHLLTCDKRGVWTFINCYMKGDFKCATWSSNTLFKTGVETAARGPQWHVDYPYHDISPPWFTHHLASPLSVQTLWLLDDFTQDNGATLIIPGSHKFNTVPTPHNILGKPDPVKLICPKGAVVISHGAWWHAQGVNTTDTARTCLLGTFTRRWIEKKTT